MITTPGGWAPFLSGSAGAVTVLVLGTLAWWLKHRRTKADISRDLSRAAMADRERLFTEVAMLRAEVATLTADVARLTLHLVSNAIDPTTGMKIGDR